MTSSSGFSSATRTVPSAAIIISGAAVLACVVQLFACGVGLRAAGFPPEATRKSPPSGIEARALKVGADFPRIELAATTGAVGFEKGKRHIVVFYRGSW